MKKIILGIALLLASVGVCAEEMTYMIFPKDVTTYSYTPPYWTGSATPAERGNTFTVGFPGWFQGMRYYKLPGATGITTGRIWNATTHALLGTVVFQNETASGWQTAFFRTVSCWAGPGYNGSCPPGQFEISLAAPIPADVGVQYMVSYSSSTTRNIAMGDIISFSPINSYPLVIAQSDGVTIINGTFSTTPGTFPGTPGFGVYPFLSGSSGGLAFADVLFRPCFCKTIGSGTVAPTETTLLSKGNLVPVSTISDAEEVELGMKFTANQSGFVYGVRLWATGQSAANVVSLWNSSGTLLGQATVKIFFGGGWLWAYLPAPVQLTAGQSYTLSWHRVPGVLYEKQAATYPFASKDDSGAPLLTATQCVKNVGVSIVKPATDCGAFTYDIDVLFSATTTH